MKLFIVAQYIPFKVMVAGVPGPLGVLARSHVPVDPKQEQDLALIPLLQLTERHAQDLQKRLSYATPSPVQVSHLITLF